MLAKGWDSDLRIHHMFFRFPPLLLATYDLRLENNAMLYAGYPRALRLTPCGILRGCPERRSEYLRYALCALLYALRRWRRIGWRNVCGAPIGKDRAIQKAGWGRHPGPKRMVFPAGANYGFRSVPQNN